MKIELAYAGIYVCAIVLSLCSGIHVKRFLKATACITDEQSLSRFKRIARCNMYMALVQIAILVSGVIIGLLLIFRHGLPGLIVVLLTNAVVFVLGKLLSKLETAARSLPAASEYLAQQHRQVSETWVKKALPDF